jgi:CubicO group peptidase (beta-lactamase class C family)
MTISRLPRSTPEAEGVPSSALLAFLDAATTIHDLHSIMLLRHGQVVAEGWWYPYAPECPHVLFSLSKSFTSSAVGLAVAEGRLSIDDPVLKFFADDAPAEVGEHLAAMRVRHLLSMSTGHAEDTTPFLHQAADGNWAKAFLARPVDHAPGTHFVYNSGATYMLSAIVQKLTGQTLLAYLQPRLLAPLGIDGATWESCPRGVNVGGWGLSIRTEDIACFGQLYLQQGMWNGVQLIPAAWVAEATSRQISNGSNPASDWEQGYGYQFWRCRHGAYRGDGAFGQFCVVLPEHEMVLAITAGVEEMQPVLDLVWQHLLPALAAAPLPADPNANVALGERLVGLALAPAQGEFTCATADHINGRHFLFDANDQQIEAVWLEFGAGETRLTVQRTQGQQTIVCGHGAWVLGGAVLERGGAYKIAASGAWLGAETYAIKLYAYETPFCFTHALHFVDDRLTYSVNANVSFGPKQQFALAGRSG